MNIRTIHKKKLIIKIFNQKNCNTESLVPTSTNDKQRLLICNIISHRAHYTNTGIE